jgi:hypothetical protein
VLPSGVSGRQLGQPRVFDTRTRSVRMLDEIIGEGWSLLGVNMPSSAWGSRAWLRSSSRTVAGSCWYAQIGLSRPPVIRAGSTTWCGACHVGSRQDAASGVGDNGRNVANAVHSLGGARTLSS